MNSTDFLNTLHPNDLWVLTAINPNGGDLETVSFGPGERDAAASWLEANNWRNIYYSLNPTRFQRVNKKLNKQGIRGVKFLHVDLDPEPNTDLQEERDRILDLLSNPPQGVPAPTTVVFSGGGYQALWALTSEYSLGDEPDDALISDVERYTRRLEEIFHADSCHNVDRIMRLPGTTNWPNEKKRKRGQTPTTAEVIWHNADDVYALDQFQQSVKSQSNDTGAADTLKISGNLRRYENPAQIPLEGGGELKAKVCDVIEQGVDPDNEQRWPSGSEACFWVCCQMARAGVSDDDMYSVLTDPSFGIAKHVLKQPDVDRYAKRQIVRAKDAAIQPELAELNDRHAVIMNFGGRTAIMRVDGHELSFQKPNDFRTSYMNRYVEVGVNKDGTPKMAKLGDWWLAHEDRRQYERVVFDPTDSTKNAYNLWRGFKYAQDDPGECDLFLTHLRDNLCRGNEAHYEWLIGWMAFAVQNPEKPAGSAIVLRGSEGTGKSFFAKHFGKLFGSHYRHVTDVKHLTGNFNAHLRDCVLLFADEAFYGGDKSQDGKLKTLITEDTIQIERKGVDVEQAANCIHMIMASNDDWVVPAGKNARRYFVLEVGSDQANNGTYFRPIAEQLENGGYAGLLRYLLQYDLSDWDRNNVPQTRALLDQKMHSAQPHESWWYGRLRDGQLIEILESGWPTVCTERDLHDDYKNYCIQLGARAAWAKKNRSELMMLLRPFGFTPAKDLDRRKAVNVPTLQEARQLFAEYYQADIEW